MKILDLSNSKRAYALSKIAAEENIQYKYFLHAGRKSLTEYSGYIDDVDTFAPEIKKYHVSRNDLYDVASESDVMLVGEFAHFKQCSKDVNKFINSFKGKLVCIDGIWDTYRNDLVVKNKSFKQKYSAIAVSTNISVSHIRPKIYWGNPEFDLTANNKFLDPEEYAKEQGFVQNDYDLIITATPGRDFCKGIFKDFLKYVKNNSHNPFIFCKFKIKNKEEELKYAKHMLNKFKIDHIISRENHRMLPNYFLMYCQMSHVHINLDRLSFSNAEAIRCGIPSFEFDSRKGLVLHPSFSPILEKFWSKDSIKKIYDNEFDCRNFYRAQMSDVDRFYCSKNLIQSIGKWYD